MLQSNQILSLFRAYERGDWSQRELQEFYRVEGALTKSGVGISTDRGLTDEGDPWFVFFRQDNEEVIVHFARIGGEYVVASNFTEAVFRQIQDKGLILGARIKTPPGTNGFSLGFRDIPSGMVGTLHVTP